MSRASRAFAPTTRRDAGPDVRPAAAAPAAAKVPPWSAVQVVPIFRCACGGTCPRCRRETTAGLQAQLEVSQPGDPLEREADRVAEQILRKRDAGMAGTATPGDPPRSPSVAPGTSSVLQAPGHVGEALRSPGRSLDPVTRETVEPALGHDLGSVRVHTDARAASSARALNALAYTVGRHIVFGRDRYRPETADGRRLLAHELVHVAQQAGGGRLSASEPRIQRFDGPDRDPPARPHGSTLPYREATELLECIRIMGEANAEYCRQEVLSGAALGPAPAPAAPCTPQPVATLDEFRAPAGGNTSAENCCAICPVPLGIGAGGQGRHGMEMRVEIANHCPGAEYEITRVRENWHWQRVGGVWTELQHQGPGVNDDHHDNDECHRLQRGRFLYVEDRPGWPVALPRAAATTWGFEGATSDAAATEVVLQFNFNEWVIFRHRGLGIPWTRISSPRFFRWHAVIWLERVGGNWRLQAGSNRIGQGLRRPAVTP